MVGSANPAGALVAPSDDEVWSFKAVLAKTGLSRSSIYSYVAQGLFPRQRRLGPRRVGWPHGNGGGYSIRLDALPVDGRFVLVAPLIQEKDAEEV